MKSIKEMTEKELREAEVTTPKSIEELNQYIDDLVTRQHDYGTCVYAMSMSAFATFNYVARKLGVTGFQASCADLDFIGRSRMMKDGFRIIDYNKLLYPQYLTEEHFPSIKKLMMDNKESLKEKAKNLLDENGERANNQVIKHWKKLAS